MPERYASLLLGQGQKSSELNSSFFDNNKPHLEWMCHSDWNGCWTWVSPNQKKAILLILTQFPRMSERYAPSVLICAKNGQGHRKITWDHTKVKVIKIEGCLKVPMLPKFDAISTIIIRVMAYCPKVVDTIFFDWLPSWKSRVTQTYVNYVCYQNVLVALIDNVQVCFTCRPS